MDLSQYIKSISHAANTILEGMAVTFSHLFREPITVQYPDKTDRPRHRDAPAALPRLPRGADGHLHGLQALRARLPDRVHRASTW